MTRSQTTEVVAMPGAGGPGSRHGLDLPLLDLIAGRLHQGAAEHGDEDFSATCLTSTPA